MSAAVGSVDPDAGDEGSADGDPDGELPTAATPTSRATRSSAEERSPHPGPAEDHRPRRTARTPTRRPAPSRSPVRRRSPPATEDPASEPADPTGRRPDLPPRRARARGPAGRPSRPDGAEAVPGEILVRYRSSADGDEREQARDEVDAEVEEKLPVPGLELVSVDSSAVGDEIEALEDDPAVLYAEPNLRRELSRTPNDDFFDLLSGMDNTGQEFKSDTRPGTPDADVDAPEAWELETGSDAVDVAVIDTGLAEHPDLDANVWRNPDETPDNRRDDDGNGYVDDVRGWDFSGSRSGEDDDTANDRDGHGTHVAGTLGADGDNDRGVAGMSWDVDMMPLKVFSSGGEASVSDIIQAYEYADREDAEVANASYGGNGSSEAERDAIARADDVLFVAAAGNDSEHLDGGSSSGEYPCSYDLENVVCVAASDPDDDLAGSSNFGCDSVDLAAPGVRVASTYPESEVGAAGRPTST